MTICKFEATLGYGPMVSFPFHLSSLVKVIIFSLTFGIESISKVNIYPKTLCEQCREDGDVLFLDGRFQTEHEANNGKF